ncbi:hypothetical protein [uncultured Acetatifactor sp.]|uniref:hypothetical protein n=1 Tax=uncultured Acetatifactor sp. TaxID=1671927 RepID=UPI002620704C|nr:hypothetical protein [uncultured Acetatifactor sp.]
MIAIKRRACYNFEIRKGGYPMDSDKKNEYTEMLLNAYNKGLLRIIWSTSGFSLGIETEKRDFIPELSEKAFVDYVFSVIKIVIDLAEGRNIDDISEEDLEVARAIYEQEDDLKNHLYIKKHSKIHCFKLLESQIISYRNDENPKETEAVSAILKLSTENGDDESSNAFEVSGRDLEYIIKYLTELKEKMDSI